MRTSICIATFHCAVGCLLAVGGCQSSIAGTWLQTSKSMVRSDGTAEPIEAQQPVLLALRNDGTAVEYLIRNGRAKQSIVSDYSTNRDILTYTDDDPHFSSEITDRFRISGDELVIDSWAKDGTVRSVYQRLD